MSCYLRHLREELEGMGVEITKENRTELDQAVHRVAGVSHKDCPAAWRNVKRMMAEDKEGFLARLREELAKG